MTGRHNRFASILVVDDDRDTAESLACLLRLFGHDTHIALDGYQAIEIARRRRPQYVLLDLALPGLDGYEVASRLRQEQADSVVIIAITGYGREEDRLQSLAAGFDHHYIKPMDRDALNSLLFTLSAGREGRGIPPIATPVPTAGEGEAAVPCFRQN